MIREVKLSGYLPPFMREYREMCAALDAAEPEFILVWKAADRTLKNEFIETADGAGLSRFENLLGIIPLKEETLEFRRNRVQILWFNTVPYTFRLFMEKLSALCGDRNFTVTRYFMEYRIEIETELELPGMAEELDRLIEMMIPCNMVIISGNRISCEALGDACVAGCVGSVEYFTASSLEYQRSFRITGSALAAGGIRCEERFVISSEED